ncbi:alanine racemase [Streptomyces lavendulae]|uniref:alanine racemase n=1 Tax=Streptomyces lavendulae TaxID=1914 RepID=UPI0036E8573F
MPTPYLAVDRDVLDRNLESVADLAHDRSLWIRPHAKTHKCPEIAERQVQLGAVGLTVATVSEAETFTTAGFDDLFIAYPVWARGRSGERLRALAEKTRLRVGVDSAEGAHLLGRALRGTGAEAVVEVDSGHHRSGASPDQAGDVALAAAAAGLRVVGAFTFPGHGYGPGRRRAAAAQEAAALDAASRELRAKGIEATVRSGGSTPTLEMSDTSVLSEIRPGVYAFNDAQQVELGSCGWDDVALSAVTTVVSRRHDRFILDAGSTVLGADQPSWTSGAGRLPDHPQARITALSEHHATVEFPDGRPALSLGDRVRVAPNHVCSAVNLSDELVVFSNGEIVDRWRVAARGANQ